MGEKEVSKYKEIENYLIKGKIAKAEEIMRDILGKNNTLKFMK
jgi:hypothetical protein